MLIQIAILMANVALVVVSARMYLALRKSQRRLGEVQNAICEWAERQDRLNRCQESRNDGQSLYLH
jgi:oligoribonuclease (3'-5' exoribonuclease)